jgi:hypothetical protein
MAIGLADLRGSLPVNQTFAPLAGSINRDFTQAVSEISGMTIPLSSPDLRAFRGEAPHRPRSGRLPLANFLIGVSPKHPGQAMLL